MKRQLVGGTVALLLGLSVIGWAQQYPLTVTDLGVEGNIEIKDRDVLEVIPFKVGDQVEMSDLRAGSQAIYDLGWFDEVMPDVTAEGAITYRVVENPVLREIVITGNTNRETFELFGIKLWSTSIMTSYKVRQILWRADVRKRKVINRASLEEGLEDVLDEYSDRGYILVSLGEVKVAETLEIELIEARVVENRVEGLLTVPASVAEELIDIPLDEPLKMQDAQRTMRNLSQSVYWSDIGVVPKQTAEADAVALLWTLTERSVIDEPIEVEAIALEGVTCFPLEDVTAALGEVPSGPIDNYRLLRILEDVYAMYVDEGYTMVRFTPLGAENGELRLRIDEGVIGEIEVTGNTRTKDYVIDRNLDLEVGSVFDRDDMVVTYQQLRSLGYFGSVDVLPEWVDDKVKVSIPLTERSSLGGFNGTLAIDPSTGGLVGELSIQQKNLFGTGQDISLGYKRGLTEEGEPEASTWNLGYSTVAYFPEFDRVGLDIYRRAEEIPAEDEMISTLTLGTGVSFAYPIADFTDLGLNYKHEEQRSEGNSRWTPTDSVGLSITYNSINDPYFPTSGNSRSFSVEQAGGFAAGNEYTKLSLTWIQFTEASLALFDDLDQTIGVRLRAGWGDDGLPLSKQFRLGGSGVVRGTDSTMVPRLFVSNMEYRVQLTEGLYMATFLDTGIDLDFVRADDVIVTTGLEFGITAAGVFVRLDLTWRLDSERSWMPRFDFGFGPMF